MLASVKLPFEVGPGVAPGVFTVEPDLAERWEQPDDMTYVFFPRKGVRWHNVPPVNGRELTAEDVKFTFERFDRGQLVVQDLRGSAPIAAKRDNSTRVATFDRAEGPVQPLSWPGVHDWRTRSSDKAWA